MNKVVTSAEQTATISQQYTARNTDTWSMFKNPYLHNTILYKENVF